MKGVRRTAGALAALALAAVALGCGREEQPDLVTGKELFVQKCASCHGLARASAKGVVGPDLDAAFAAARRAGMNDETIEGVVRAQIANPRRGSAMPSDLVVGEDAKDVAAYVAQAAAEPGQDAGELAQAGRPKTSSKPVTAKNGQLKLNADPGGALAFSASRAIAKAGALTIVMGNPSQIQHNVALKGGGVDAKGPVVGNGGTSRVQVKVKKGSYTFYCSVPGHEAGGMKGQLTVQ